MAHKVDKWQGVTETEINPQIPQNVGNIFCNRKHNNFEEEAQLHGVS